MNRLVPIAGLLLVVATGTAAAGYVNFESSHVHPIDLTPSGGRLLAVNTPDALLEVWAVQPDGTLVAEDPVPVGLEPVTVVARTDTEAWVVNNLSDTISIVDLAAGATVQTLDTGDEPTDVVFAAGKAFVSVSQEDAVYVYTLANLGAAPTVVPLFGRDVRALAVSNDGQKVYAVVQRSGNQTTVVHANIIFNGNSANMNGPRLAALGLSDMVCANAPPAYPPLPPGIERSPALLDPPPSANPADFPPVGLIVKWDEASGQWRDEADQNWNDCLPYRLPDHDLFVIDANTLAVTEVDHLGTTLFEVSVHPQNGMIYVPNTDARNFVRFEHPLGVQGHMVDNLLSIVNPAAGNSVTQVDLNAHINRASDPATNLAEREASISQPGMMVWKADGSAAYLSAIGSRKVFRVDGGCTTAACIFGANRAAPDAVEVGEGPTGVALAESKDRLYVLNRISHSLAIVEASTLVKLDEIPLHDPSTEATRVGRRFMYDAIDGSGHGDSACSTCHISGDMDGLAWDLGNPEGGFVPYTTPNDNVRFVIPQSGEPAECNSPFCAAHDGFDPQKGPMTTQTLRAMLEPLHWRGDRATFNDFNAAFVDLMGTADIGPVNGKPAGLSAIDMEKFRQFALEMRMPPNPGRNVDDSTPCGTRATDPGCEVQAHGSLRAGNPTEGALLFDNLTSDAGQPCKACHSHPHGAAGGTLGGVAPTEPTSLDAAGLFFGTADGSAHNDLKVPHLRNMYDKFGPVWGTPGGAVVDTKTGFGMSHDGSIPDMFRFLSINVFTLATTSQAQQLRDIAAFMFHFPTGTKPSVGRQVTVPAGTPPTGSAGEESLLTSLIGLGDLALSGRHCELAASTVSAGRVRRYHLDGGVWTTDVAGEPSVTTTALREGASSPITFTCGTLDSGPRLGGDRDEDLVLDGDDCAPADAATLAEPVTVAGLQLDRQGGTTLSWDDQSPTVGESVVYDVLTGDLASVSTGFAGASCAAAGLATPAYADPTPDPAPSSGVFFVVRAVNPCGSATLGAGRESLDSLACP